MNGNIPLSRGALLHQRNRFLGQKSGIRRKAPTNIIVLFVLTNEAIQAPRSASSHKALVDLDIRAKSKAIVILF